MPRLTHARLCVALGHFIWLPLSSRERGLGGEVRGPHVNIGTIVDMGDVDDTVTKKRAGAFMLRRVSVSHAPIRRNVTPD